MRVAVNVARDHLRRRRARAYTGPWLPGPIDLDDPRLIDDAPSPEACCSRRESLSHAFLVALEVLTPGRRAVLLLRDVFDCSVRETAALLNMSETNVKSTLHRARQDLAGYEAEKRAITPRMQGAALHALTALAEAVQRGDHDAVAALLSPDVVLLSDGGGRYHAALRPVVGPEQIAKLYINLLRSTSAALQVEVRVLNGLPALVASDPGLPGTWAPRWIMRCEVDDLGRIRRLHSILADDKVAGAFRD